MPDAAPWSADPAQGLDVWLVCSSEVSFHRDLLFDHYDYSIEDLGCA
jgi:hypothetical protein